MWYLWYIFTYFLYFFSTLLISSSPFNYLSMCYCFEVNCNCLKCKNKQRNKTRFMVFHSHKTFYAAYQIQHTTVSEKTATLIIKCQKLNSVTISGSTLSAYSSMLLLLHLTLAGPPRFSLSSACMYPSICYLIRNNMYINIHVLLQENRQREQLSF